MDALAQKKIGEAKHHIADAEKSMKTSLFKRKPDLESASSSYAQAGSCFRVAKDFKQAIECFQKAADCFVQNNSLYNAAKQYEQISMMASEIKNYTLLFESIQKAAEYMITSGTRDSAGILLERGANMLRVDAPEKSLQLYKRALQIAEVEEKYHEMIAYYENMISLSLRANQYNETISIINEAYEILDKVGSPEQYTKYILTAMIVYLSRDDWVGAKSYLNDIRQRYDMQVDGPTRMDDLLQAYDEKDDAKFKELIKNYLSHTVDNEALKLAQKIVKSDDWIKAVQENKPQPAAASNYPLPPVQTGTFKNDKKIDLEPDGSELAEEDLRQKEKNEHEEDNEEPFVNNDQVDVKVDVEPNGCKIKNDDHHQNEKMDAEEDDEFADGLL